jgi:hypothetical protein
LASTSSSSTPSGPSDPAWLSAEGVVHGTVGGYDAGKERAIIQLTELPPHFSGRCPRKRIILANDRELYGPTALIAYTL